MSDAEERISSLTLMRWQATLDERDALKAENARLHAALVRASEALLFFSVEKRTEAYLAASKALEARP